MNLSQIERKYANIAITAKDAYGNAFVPSAVDIALVTPDTYPTTATVWTPSTFSGGVARILLAGPSAAGNGALVVPLRGADLWIRVANNPEVLPVRVVYIDIL